MYKIKIHQKAMMPPDPSCPARHPNAALFLISNGYRPRTWHLLIHIKSNIYWHSPIMLLIITLFHVKPRPLSWPDGPNLKPNSIPAVPSIKLWQKICTDEKSILVSQFAKLPWTGRCSKQIPKVQIRRAFQLPVVLFNKLSEMGHAHFTRSCLYTCSCVHNTCGN